MGCMQSKKRKSVKLKTKNCRSKYSRKLNSNLEFSFEQVLFIAVLDCSFGAHVFISSREIHHLTGKFIISIIRYRHSIRTRKLSLRLPLRQKWEFKIATAKVSRSVLQICACVLLFRGVVVWCQVWLDCSPKESNQRIWLQLASFANTGLE